jgi:hypothetical protein
MKRIDLASKLVAPIFVSLAAMRVESQVIMTLAVAGMNIVLLLPEWFCAKWVWSSCPKLREPRQLRISVAGVEEAEEEAPGLPPQTTRERWGSSLKVYFDNSAWRRMTFLSTALRLVINLNSLPCAGSSVLLCTLIVGIDDNLPPKCSLHVILNNRSPFSELGHRALLYHYHALGRFVPVYIQ